MNSYTKLSQPEIVWIARGGQVGTAHLSRDGRWVDFRPARSVRAEVSPYTRYIVRCTYYPAKGVQTPEERVYYNRVRAVDYRTGEVTAYSPDNPFCEGEPPAEVTAKYEFGKLPEIAGFPIPEDVLRDREAERERVRRALDEHDVRIQAVTDAVTAWAEGLTGQERRWMSRFLNFGKAEAEVEAAALAAFPEVHRREVLAALKALRATFNS